MAGDAPQYQPRQACEDHARSRERRLILFACLSCPVLPGCGEQGVNRLEQTSTPHTVDPRDAVDA
jgi:hypothetical protein